MVSISAANRSATRLIAMSARHPPIEETSVPLRSTPTRIAGETAVVPAAETMLIAR